MERLTEISDKQIFGGKEFKPVPIFVRTVPSSLKAVVMKAIGAFSKTRQGFMIKPFTQAVSKAQDTKFSLEEMGENLMDILFAVASEVSINGQTYTMKNARDKDDLRIELRKLGEVYNWWKAGEEPPERPKQYRRH